MLILSENEIQTNYLMKDAIDDVKQGLISKSTGKIYNPHRTVIDVPTYQGSALYMPSADFSREMAAMKVVSIFPENPAQGMPTTQGALLLTDGRTGEHLCMMNASYLTRLRTGALSGIATEKLARKRSTILGVIGTGAMSFEQVLGVLEVRDIDTIKLFNRTYEKANVFKEKLIAFGVQQKIEVMSNVDDLVQSSDIISCATRSNKAVFNGKLVKAGTHINGVGSFLPSTREIDLYTIQNTTKLVVDDLTGAKEEAGELIDADENHNWSFSEVYAELSDLAGDDDLTREEDELTVFKSVGAAYFDLVVAQGIYAKLKELGVGTDVEV